MKKIVILIFIISNICFSQERTKTSFRKITGIIVDEFGVSIPGLNVMIKGTEIGTQTDLYGNFCLIVPNNKTIFLEFLFCFEPILRELKPKENRITLRIEKGKRKSLRAYRKWNTRKEMLIKELDSFYKSEDYYNLKEYICS